MYTLLIVDDEMMIADGLKYFFENESELDMQIEKAYSVREALQIMEKSNIHIVLTDICMPGMNGMEFHEKIIKLWPECKVIFLTGHDEFDYVHTAIRNNSMDFILKSEDDAVILEAVKKALTSIEAEHENKRYLEKAREQLALVLPILQEKYLLELLKGLRCTLEERKVQFEELKINLHAGMPIYVIVGRLEDFTESIAFSEKIKIIFEIKNLIVLRFEKYAKVASITYEKDKLVWLLQSLQLNPESGTTGRDGNDLYKLIQSLADEIQRSVRRSFTAKLSLAYTSQPVSWGDLKRSLVSLEMLLEKSAGIESEVIVSNERNLKNSNHKTQLLEEEYIVWENLKKLSILETYLRSGQQKEFNQLFKSITDDTRNTHGTPYGMLKEVYYSIAVILLSHINRNRLENELENHWNIQLNKLLNLEQHTSWNDSLTYLSTLVNCMFEIKSQQYRQNSDQVVDKIRAYVEDNLDKEISLSRLAEIVFMNASYLSRIFKQAVGVNVTDYIAEKKLAKAIDLLKHTDKSISDIALSLGFTSLSYFSIFFKKYTNISPTDYREMQNKW